MLPSTIVSSPLTIDTSGVYFRPEGPNYIAGSSPRDGQPDPDTLDLDVDRSWFEQVIWPAIAHRVPAFEAIRLLDAWAGHYEVNTLDHNAVIGPHPELPNFLFANGFSGHGLPQVVVGHREQEVTSDLVQPEVVQRLLDREEAHPVARQLRIGRPEDKWLVSLIRAVIEERRGLGVGPGDDDAGHPHDVQLQARRIEPLVLLVLGDKDLARLVAAFLGARFLVLDVVARYPDLDEPTDEIPDVRVAAVSGVSVGDDGHRRCDHHDNGRKITHRLSLPL